MTIIFLLAGLVCLVLGGDLLVRWSSRLASLWGLPSLVVGLTVVAFGTSAPELAVSVAAAWRDQAEIAVGNVVGSNIFNILLILGLSAVIAPLVVRRSIVRRELPLLVASALAMLLFSLDGQIARWEGFLLVAGLVALTVWLVRNGRREAAAANLASEHEVTAPLESSARIWPLLLGIAFSLGLLVVGSRLLVTGAVSIATALGVSELVIGLTIVAAGTSLPEVAASVAATLRGERDMAIGNVVGSNIFNVLCVLGCSALISPRALPVPPEAIAFDLPFMVAATLLCLPVFLTGARISRTEGVLFLALYAGYTSLLIVGGATGFISKPLGLAALLTLTLVVLAIETFRSRRSIDAMVEASAG